VAAVTRSTPEPCPDGYFVVRCRGVAIRFVYFDVGGTLLDPKPSVGHVYQQAGAPLGLEASADELDAAFRACWQVHLQTLGRKPMTMAKTEEENVDWWRQLVFRVFDRIGFDGDREAVFRAFFAAFESPEAWHVYEDTRPTLDALRRLGLPLGILSNWDHRLPPLLEAMGLTEYFDPILVSTFEAMEKPDPRFFELAVQRAKVPATDILYVGDHIDLDLDPARSVGMQAYLIDRKGRQSSPWRIKSLTELLALVEQL